MTDEKKQLSLIPQCSTEGCANPPTFRFTWPGKAEQIACQPCTLRQVRTAKAMDVDLNPQAYFPF